MRNVHAARAPKPAAQAADEDLEAKKAKFEKIAAAKAAGWTVAWDRKLSDDELILATTTPPPQARRITLRRSCPCRASGLRAFRWRCWSR